MAISTTADALAATDLPLTIGGRSFRSRLLVGTGKYRSNSEMVAALDASGAEVVTVAVRRVDLDRSKEEGVLYHLDSARFFLLANTAGCYTADEAVRYARLGREAGFNDFVKLEVIGDRETLLPDTEGLLAATRTLAAEGFKVMAYTNDDLITALRLEEAGCVAVMPLASPIGSGLGLLNPYSIRTIKTPAFGSGDRGRRGRDRIGCLPHDGAGSRRDPDEHRPGRSPGAGDDGDGDASRGGGRAAGLPGGPDAEARGGGAFESDPRDAGAGVTVSTLPAADARRSALRILDLVADGATFDAALDSAVEGLEERDRRLAHELAAGVLRQRQRLDDALAPHVARGIASVQPQLRRILELGAYQLTSLDRVPAHAAVSVCVDLARSVGGEKAAGFVNAVLRKVGALKDSGAVAVEAGGREGGRVSGDSIAAPEGRGLAHQYSHPGWLVDRWLQQFGAAETVALLKWNNRKPPLIVQPARASLPELAEEFEAAGIGATPAPFGAGLVVDARQPRELPGYDRGDFMVQDAAQSMVIRYADIPDDSTVLDACAAPGGKAVTLGRTARRVLACDRSRERVARLAANLARAGSGRVWPIVALAEQPPVRDADAVLLDAPCLGTGTFARHPDARHRVSREALKELAARQRTLLDGLVPAVRRGGLLIYSTCSLEPEENALQVKRFLEAHPEFRREPSTAVPPELRSSEGDLVLLPQRHGTDGAYAARLRKLA